MGNTGQAILAGRHTAGSVVISSPIALTKTLVLDQAAGGTLTLAGLLSGTGGLTLGGSILDAGSPTQTGVASRLLLTASNTFTGQTTLLAGTLEVAGSLGNTKITVGDATTGNLARLSGAGSIANSVGNAISIKQDGIIAPGNGVGKLTTGSQLWQGGGTYEWEISNPNGTPGNGWDLLELNATTMATSATAAEPFKIDILRVGGAATAIDIASTKWFTIAHVGSITGFQSGSFVVTDAAGGQPWDIRENPGATGGVDIQIRANAVPEPSSVMLAGTAVVGMLLSRRSRVTR